MEASATADEARRAGHVPEAVIDALLGTAVALALALIIAIGEGGDRPPDAAAYAFAAGFGVLMLLRRRLPRTMLILSVLGMFAYYIVGYPPIGVAMPVAAALFSVAEAGLVAWSAGAAAVVFAVSLFFRLTDGTESAGFVLGYESVSNIALFVSAIALGYSVRARRLHAAQQAEIARLERDRLAREAELRGREERERLSRELHDTVGHALSVISLHAGVASEAVGSDDDSARTAVEHIRSTSTGSMHDLRSMVRLLRADAEGEAEPRRIHSLTEIDRLVGPARAAGLTVTTAIDADPAGLSAPVDAAAYRVVQESLTNVIRHAAATTVHVSAAVHEDRLRVTVVDDGRGLSPGGAAPGYGIVGMTERIAVLGGTLTTRSPDGGGLAVDAELPARLS